MNILDHQKDDAFLVIEAKYEFLIQALTQSILREEGLEWSFDEDGSLIIEGSYGKLNELICTQFDNGEFSEQEIEDFAGMIGFC